MPIVVTASQQPRIPTAFIRKTGYIAGVFLLLALTATAASLRRTPPPPPPGSIQFSARERCGESFVAWPLIVRVIRPDSWGASPSDQWSLVELNADGLPAYRIPFQILDRFDDQGNRSESATPHSLDLCFPITLNADETRTYQLLQAATAAPVPWTPHRPADLRITGRGPGAQIDTGNAVFGFHPANGQFGWYIPKNAGVTNRLGFVQGNECACHHNPDVWCVQRSWGHTSDWRCQATNDLAPEQIIQEGPLAYRFIRSGAMPYCDGVRAQVSYTVLAGLPILLESSSMEFTKSLTVYAVRNNELVFNRGIHTHAAYPDRTGKPMSLRAYDPQQPSNFLGRLSIPDLDPDIPWVALYHDTRQYGIAMLNLERWTQTGAPTRPANMPAYYYFNDYGDHGTGARYDWNFLYLCRAEVFTLTALPAGAQFSENSAVLILQEGTVRPDRLRDIESWRKKLEFPPLIKFTAEHIPL